MASKEFYVTLLSNASHELYPGNTVTTFTNVLPKALTLPREEKWRVCLHHLALAASDQEAFDKKEDKRLAQIEENADRQVEETASTTLLNWYLSIGNQVRRDRGEMFMEKCCKEGLLFVRSPNVTSFTNSNVLSVTPIHPFSWKGDKTHVYEPETNAYFDLTSNYITELNVELANFRNEAWKYKTSQPTLLVLKFKSMFQDRNDFHTVRVTNEGFSSITDFRVALPDNLLRIGEQNPWEMALTQMSFVPNFHQFEKGRSYKWSFGYAQKGLWVGKQAAEGWMEFPRDNLTVNQLFKYLQDYFGTQELVPLTFGIRRVNKVTHLQIFNTTRYQKSPVALSIPWQLTYMLGLNGPKCEINAGNIRIDIDYLYPHLAGMPMDPNFLIPSNLLLYCDAIEPSSIGNTFGSYLTNISVKKESSNQMITLEPKNLEYHTVTTGDLGNVQFQLFQTDGTPPKFINENEQKIFMTFLFRRKNNQ